MATGLFLLAWTESFNGHVEAFPFLARPYPASPPWQVEESPAPVAETGVGSPSRFFSGGLLRRLYFHGVIPVALTDGLVLRVRLVPLRALDTTWSFIRSPVGLSLDTSNDFTPKTKPRFADLWIILDPQYFDTPLSDGRRMKLWLRSAKWWLRREKRRHQLRDADQGDHVDQVDLCNCQYFWTPASGNSSPLELGQCFRTFPRHVAS